MGRVNRSVEIKHRDELALLCEWRRLETYVEIGVDRGVFSARFMARNQNFRHYIGVDPYASTAEFPSSRDPDMHIAIAKYARHENATLLRMTSAAFAESLRTGQYGHIKEGVVDFVYIDAGHEYADVQQDIATWWPLVSEKGILAGHDYDWTHPGVMRAVEEFADQEHVQIWTTEEHPESWYCYKDRTTPITRRY